MDDALRYDKALLRAQLDNSILEIHDEPAFEDKEELVIVVVFMPVIFTLHDTQPNNRVVDLAQRLVVPAIGRRCGQMKERPPRSATDRAR